MGCRSDLGGMDFFQNAGCGMWDQLIFAECGSRGARDFTKTQKPKLQVETEKIPHTTDNNGRPASPASGGRCGIIPITKIHAVILVSFS